MSTKKTSAAGGENDIAMAKKFRRKKNEVQQGRDFRRKGGGKT